MKTVTEVASVTGISARTLRWYDQIGLLKPTAYSKSGYRLYDDSALEILRQILFFREFDISLSEIKAILQDPNFDRAMVLTRQKQLLEAKKARLERLIAGIQDILKGDTTMDFTVFDTSEIEEITHSMIKQYSDEQLEAAVNRYGSLEAFRSECAKGFAKPETQSLLLKLLAWYGSKDQAIQVLTAKPDPEETLVRANRILDIYRRLSEKMDLEPAAPQVQQLVGELANTMRTYSQIENVKPLLLEMADASLHDDNAVNMMDSRYGKGWTEFFIKTLVEFCKQNRPLPPASGDRRVLD